MVTAHEITEKLKSAGLRPTRQRLMLGSLLWCSGVNRHVTAEQLHSESRQANMQVSMATVYNTLHQFVEAGLLGEVVISGGRCYFDTNMDSHHHFLHEATGELEDIPAEKIILSQIPLPACGTKTLAGVSVIVRVR